VLDKNSVLAIVGLWYVGLPLAIEFGKIRDLSRSLVPSLR
jgi:UDP-N-acetyl-D-mannosaminuronate dehydrogenase